MEISVWWDMESCPIPSEVQPQDIACIDRALLCSFNIAGNVQQFSAYANYNRVNEELRQILSNSAFRLRHVPPGRKETVEKAMLVDVLCWSIDVPPPATIIFIVGNIDLSSLLHGLSQMTYEVLLVCTCANEIPQSMLAGVIDCTEWMSVLRLLLYQPINLPLNQSLIGLTAPMAAIGCYSERPALLDHWPDDPFSDQMSFMELRYSVGELESHPHETYTTFPPRTISRCHDNYAIPLCPQGANYIEYRSPIRVSEFAMSSHGTNAIAPLISSSFCNRRCRSDHLNAWKGSSSKSKRKLPKRPYGYAKHETSMDRFKSWLLQFVQSQRCRYGYPISLVRPEYKKTTGKVLDPKYFGFTKLSLFLEEFKDVAMLKEVHSETNLFPVESTPRTGLHSDLRTPVRPATLWEKPKASEEDLAGVSHSPAVGHHKGKFNVETAKWVISAEKPLIKASNPDFRTSELSYSKHESLAKGSVDDLKFWLSHMLRKEHYRRYGWNISNICRRFKADTGKVIDLEYLGYNKLSELLERFSDIVSLKKYRSSIWLFAADGLNRHVALSRGNDRREVEGETVKGTVAKNSYLRNNPKFVWKEAPRCSQLSKEIADSSANSEQQYIDNEVRNEIGVSEEMNIRKYSTSELITAAQSGPNLGSTAAEGVSSVGINEAKPDKNFHWEPSGGMEIGESHIVILNPTLGLTYCISTPTGLEELLCPLSLPCPQQNYPEIDNAKNVGNVRIWHMAIEYARTWL